jgi:hypothetical protein
VSPSAPTRPDSWQRVSWPLYLLAGLGFIPILGFFIGSLAVTWGLVSERPGARRAAAIGATGALLNALAVVVIMATATGGNGGFRQEYRKAIGQNLVDLVQALEEYRAHADAYPETLEVLRTARGPLRAVQILDLGAGVFRMPRSYQYVVAPDGSSYDLFSVGPDGKPGTIDDIRPLLPDSSRGRTGLRPAP